MHNLGLTRSSNARDHLLLTPDTFIRTPLPGHSCDARTQSISAFQSDALTGSPVLTLPGSAI